MPLPFEFEGKGVVWLENQQEDAQFLVPYANPLVHFQNLVNKKRKYYINEPRSVLDNITTSPSPPASTSTLSSSHGGAETAGVAALSSKWPPPENQETSTSNVGGVLDLHHFQQLPLEEKCGGMEDWENGDSGQDQAMLRWIMGDVEDPSMGLNKMLHGNPGGDFEFNGGFGVVDQGFIGLDSGNPVVSQIGNLSSNPQLPPSPTPAMFNNNHHHHQNQIFSPLNETQMLPFDVKPNLFNPQFPFEHLIQVQLQTHFS